MLYRTAMDKILLPTEDCARLVRDGGIDAVAGLDAALRDALVGLSPKEQLQLKHAFGAVMGEIIEKLINPALRAFPELEPDQTAWHAIAKARAAMRAKAV